MRRSLASLERATAAELKQYQDQRLRRMVAWVAVASPFYRSWFAENGVSPRDIRTIEDLAVLPLIDRTHLSGAPAQFCAYPERMMWPSRSSGTSGRVVKVYRTPGSSSYELSALQRQWGWFGVDRRARRLVMRAEGSGLGEETPTSLTTLVPGANQMLLSAYMLGRADPDELLAVIRDFQPDAVEGWPSCLGLLASMLERRQQTLPVKAVITSSEVMTQSQVRALRQAFQAPVVDHYGQTERVTLAGSCEAGGYHLFSDYAVTELLPVPGVEEQWEIVGTPLHNWGFPLLRYRTGDTVGPAPQGPCPCGRSFPLLGRIGGRSEDSFTSADGRPLPLPATVLDDVDDLEESQIAQLAPGRFEVRMVPRPSTDLDRARHQLQSNIDRYFGSGQTVTFVLVDHVPRLANGKTKAAVIESSAAGDL